MNRQTRRHKQHPALPILYPEKRKVLDKKTPRSLVNTHGFSKIIRKKSNNG